jgi:hypothetical protein
MLIEDYNYSRRDVDKMTPSEAQYILANNIKKRPPPRTVFDAQVGQSMLVYL